MCVIRHVLLSNSTDYTDCQSDNCETDMAEIISLNEFHNEIQNLIQII